MALNLDEKVALPLRWQNDIIYMANTRIPIDTVIARYLQGYTPEQIVEGFPTLKLAEVYFAVAYYWEHREALDEYLHKRALRAEELRLEDERRNPTDGLREKLLKRLADKQMPTK